MKNVRLYNIIFPLYISWILPPFIFISLVGNLLIDFLVIFAMAKILKIWDKIKNKKKIIFKAWGYGFLADIIGAIIFTVFNQVDLIVDFAWFTPQEIEFTAWVVSWLFTLLAFLVVGYCIFKFNSRLFKKEGLSEKEVFKLSLAMAIITLPWTWLLPINLSHF